MNIRSLSSALLVLSLGIAPALADLPPKPAPGTEVKISDEAKKHFAAGVDFINDPGGTPKYEEAYREFITAYTASPSWKILTNLGLSAQMIERNGEAIEAYERFVEAAGALGKKMPADDRAKLPQVEKDLNLLKASSATVTLKSDVDGSISIVDQRVRSNGSLAINTYTLNGKGPLTLKVQGGHHIITAKINGKEDRWETDLTSSQPTDHSFALGTTPTAPTASATTAPLAPTTAPTATTAPTSEPPATSTKTSPLRTAGYVTAGVGGALLIGGVVTGILGKSQLSSLKDSCTGNSCPASKKSDADSIETKQTLTNVFLIGGGVLAATGVTLIVLGKPKAEPAAATLQITPSVNPGLAGVFAGGTF
ncbi:MAG: hypothetical protein U0165_03140 [Polyangiaceae bacterium]